MATVMDSAKDTAERLAWTFVSAGLAAVGVAVADADPIWGVAAATVINWLLIKVRQKAGWLPNPGEGLPGLPTGN